MPSKKRKYNARFPAGRIKRIMQADEEVGKIAHAVPVIISRTLELFVESLLTKSSQITLARNSKTLSPSHLKQCIMSESRFDFLKDLVKNVPDISNEEGSGLTNEEHPQQNKEQNSVPVAYNGIESNGSSSSVQQPRMYQRSQSFQPSTSTQPPQQQQQQQQQITQYHNTTIQQKQFYLNNYTSISKQNTKQLNPNIPQQNDYRPSPAKISRFNSIPSSTITSEQHHQLPPPLPPQTKQSSLAPLEFPIQITYNIDGKTASTDSPTVKIDYSKLSLPATSPSIKIDLSNFSSPMQATSTIQQPSNASTSATLDEDYDA
ncbi:dr1-associated corepressor [Chironomus tepperi]|uniref:dr1-associated corepressor n=1 Tax=Chironomus tepperi TaxID=113505 RepID=UPI00391EF76F